MIVKLQKALELNLDILNTDILKLPLQTDSVSNIEDASPEGWDRKDIQKNLIDPPNCDIIYHTEQGSADDKIKCKAVFHAPGGDKDENQAIVLSVKYEVAAQSRTDLNYSLKTNANKQLVFL